MNMLHTIVQCKVFNKIKIEISVYERFTVIRGNSGSGKSFIYNSIKEMAAQYPRYKCFNFFDRCNIEILKTFNDCVIAIDNADVILDKALREYISTDKKNYYLILGRDVKYLYTGPYNLAEVKANKNSLELTFPYI